MSKERNRDFDWHGQKCNVTFNGFTIFLNVGFTVIMFRIKQSLMLKHPNGDYTLITEHSFSMIKNLPNELVDFLISIEIETNQINKGDEFMLQGTEDIFRIKTHD